MTTDQEQNDTDDQPIADETADVPVENGPWDDEEDFFQNYQY